MIAFVVLWFTCSYYFHDFKIRFFSHTFWMCIALAWTLLVLHWMVVFCGLQVLLAKLQLCAWRGWETRWRNATSVRSTCKLFHLTLVSFRLMSEKQRHQTVGTCYCACVTHMEITMLVWHAWRSLCLCDTHGDYYACVTCIMYGASLGWQSFFKITEKLRRLPPHSPPPNKCTVTILKDFNHVIILPFFSYGWSLVPVFDCRRSIRKSSLLISVTAMPRFARWTASLPLDMVLSSRSVLPALAMVLILQSVQSTTTAAFSEVWPSPRKNQKQKNNNNQKTLMGGMILVHVNVVILVMGERRKTLGWE